MYTTAWIPSEYAEEGRYLALKKDDIWEDGWKVVRVWSTIDSTTVIAQNERHRKGMFPSLKK